MEGPHGKDVAFALDTSTGKFKWKQELGPAFKHGTGDGSRGTPTVDGDSIYFIRGGGDLHCLDAATGKPRWKKALKSDLGGKLMSGWGYSESPLIDGDQLICTPGGDKGALAALNKKTGGEIWRSSDFASSAAYSSPIVVEVGGIRQYVQMTRDGVVGVAAKDGKVLWSKAAAVNGTAIIPTPIFRDDQLYVTSGYGAGCALIKLTPKDGGVSADQAYANKNMVNHHGGVILVDGYIYGYSDGKGWVCQNVKTGDIVWKDESLGKGSLTCAAGHLFCFDEKTGTLACVNVSTMGWEETGRMELPEKSKIKTQYNKIWTHPVIANGKLYLRHQDLLFCFELKDSVAAN